MWLLDSISRIPFQKPYLILTGVLGAVFLLLAHFLFMNALHEPLTYAVVAPALLFGFGKQIQLRNIAFLTGAASILAFLLFPAYRLLFGFAFSLLIGKWIFTETFRAWKWIACSALFLLSLQMITAWQNMDLLNTLKIPPYLFPAIHASLLSFCIYCSYLLYAVRKDAVAEAFDHYSWKTSSDAALLARETMKLYSELKAHFPISHPDAKEEFETYTEKMIHLCNKLQEITEKLDASNPAMVQMQTSELHDKLQQTSDSVAKVQYEQAIANKEKQLLQIENLQHRQERLRGQIVNYNSALETMQMAYATREMNSAGTGAESVNFFMDVAKVRAEHELFDL